MPRRKVPRDYRALARSRGLIWLGTEPPGTQRLTTWRCRKHGHVFERTYNRILAIQGCSICSGRVSKTPADYHALAHERGFRWLGPTVATTRVNTRWRCAQGHTFTARYSTIQQGSGCPHCGRRAPKDRADYETLARRRRLTWLGPLPATIRFKTRWRCSKGHGFPATYNTIQQGHGCPTCAGNRPPTAADYRQAGRAQGLTWIGPPGANRRARSRWRCRHGHIWETVLGTVERGHGCPWCRVTVRKTETDFRALARERRLTWLGKRAVKTSEKTTWRCSKGHFFDTTYSILLQGSGCPTCAGHGRKTPADFRAVAKNLRLTWLGPEVESTTEKTSWQCAAGHRFQSTYAAVRSGHGCRICAGNAPRTAADYRRAGRRRGITWLGPLGANTAVKTRWRCRKGHLWVTTLAVIVNGHQCPRCLGRARKTEADYRALARRREITWIGPTLPRNTMTPTLWECARGHRWRQRFQSVQQGSGCPTCARAPLARRAGPPTRPPKQA